MQDKQKVTLYLSSELHRRLKIRAAVDSEPMSTLVERAVIFYLEHPDAVEAVEASRRQVHQVYTCPDCSGPAVLRNGQMVSLRDQPGVLAESDDLSSQVPASNSGIDQHGEEELVPC